ncbi:MAG: hypothetical protein RR252_01615 [Longicatena sp.]
MNRMMKRLACLLFIGAMVSGCSMNKKEETTKETDKVSDTTQNDTKKVVDESKQKVNDSVDNVMKYFKDQGVAYDNMKNIENINFAAYEGRSFMSNGQMSYIYRVKSEDENMEKILKEAKNNGKVKVNIDNKEQEYGAKVNGDYLLLYNSSANTTDLLKAFPNYKIQ